MHFPGRRLVVATVLFVFSLSLTQACGQALPKIPQIQPFGIDGFRLMLQQQGLDATIDRVGTALNDRPKETVAVILGKLKTVTEGNSSTRLGMQDQLENFVRNGGALLIASDVQSERLQRTNVCGTWVQRLRRWLQPDEAVNGYNGFHDCPIVTDFNRAAEPELFKGVTELVANRPSQIIDTDRTSEVAWMPMRGRQALMSVKRLGKGKMLFIADHSFFVNEMLVHGDNAQFANNVTKWLSARTEDGEPRSRLVLINDGRVMSNWTFGDTLPSVPLSSLLRAAESGALDHIPIGDSILPLLNESIARSQQEREFNSALQKAAFVLAGGRRSSDRQRVGFRLGVLVMVVFLLVSSVFWVVGTRSKPQRWLAFQDWSQPRRRQRRK